MTNTTELYVDGVLDDSTSGLGAHASNSRNINIGVLHGGINGALRFLNGNVDELRISNNVLSSDLFLTGDFIPTAKVPLPAFLPLLTFGVAAIGWIGRCKR